MSPEPDTRKGLSEPRTIEVVEMAPGSWNTTPSLPDFGRFEFDDENETFVQGILTTRFASYVVTGAGTVYMFTTPDTPTQGWLNRAAAKNEGRKVGINAKLSIISKDNYSGNRLSFATI